MTEKRVILALIIGVILLFVTSNLPYAMLVYIHTNLSSGLFLFLTVVSLYFAIEEDNESWLVLSGLSLFSFGLMRIENVLIALLIIFFYLARGKLSWRQSILTFVPYLLFQGIWYFYVHFMDVSSFLSSMEKEQILLISIGCFVMIVVILLSRWKFLKSILNWASKIVPFLLLAAWVVLGFLNPEQGMTNLRAILSNIFISGNWGFFWIVTLSLFVISLFSGRFPQKGTLINIMVSFVAIVEILGFFRHPYHDQWYDSANRMMIHIAPLVLFFVITQIAKASSLSRTLPETEDATKAA
jgi:hypothetical protein